MAATASPNTVLIIGGGPAGLATAVCLRNRGVPALIVEQGPAVAHSWTQYYDRLRLHTGKHLSNLPDLPLGRDYPLYVPRDELVRYFQDYARRFNLAVSLNDRVSSVAREGAGWRVESERAVRHSPAVVVASGFFANPVAPRFPGQDDFGGPILHSAAYRNPASLPGQRVLVVGAGNSGAEIAVELRRAGRQVTIAIRSGINIVPRDLAGVPIQYLGYVLQRLPRGMARRLASATDRQSRQRLARAGLPKAPGTALDAVPVIGLDLLDEVRAGHIAVRGAIASLQPRIVCFADGRAEPFDAIVLATGYNPAVSFLRPLAADPATLIPPVGVACPTEPGLYFVGLHRTTEGLLYLVSRREAPQAANLIAAQYQFTGVSRKS
jgi:cation diffusion facilitator CzcD-associated flavoprotein CzcO